MEMDVQVGRYWLAIVFFYFDTTLFLQLWLTHIFPLPFPVFIHTFPLRSALFL